MSLPNGEAQKIIKKNYFKNINLKFIDLSADFRITNPKLYEKVYNLKHKAKKLLIDLKDKINDLAECLFVLNNKRYGPIPGAYMVMCTKPGKEWCVAQLNADRAKPFILYEDKVFTSITEAQKEAEKIKKERGESAPRRCT